jgi:hypothetical protein
MKTKLISITRLILICEIFFSVNQIFAADSATNSVSGTNEPSPFKIIVMPRKTRVRAGEKFKVGLEVKNVSNTNQLIKIWTCGWGDNWESGNPAVKMWSPTQCRSNVLIEHKLASGESYKHESDFQEAKMEVIQSLETNKVVFRVGFTSGFYVMLPDSFFAHGKQEPQSSRADQGNPNAAYKTYWNDDVAIEVVPN